MFNGLGGNAFTRNIWFDHDPMSRSYEALPSTSCDLCTSKVWSCYGQWLRRCITKKIHCLILTPRSRESKSHKMLRSTLDFTSKVWCCYIPWLMRRCITSKYIIWPWSWAHKLLPSTLDIMWPMHQQSLILLHPMVKEKMHLQENTLFDLGHMKCCPVPSTSCDLCTNRVWSYNVKSLYKKIQYLTLGSRSHKFCSVTSTSYD